MRIGVDLDNTLICYEQVFLACSRHMGLVPEKWEGKEFLRKHSGSDESWKRLQGQVYGAWSDQATLYSGVYRFLWRCCKRGILVEIVSHKSNYGHYDQKRTPLRKVAIEFLNRAGIYSCGAKSLIDKVIFCSSRDEKLKYICERGFDWFIDDLPEIADSDVFQKNTKSIGFNPSGDIRFTKSINSTSWFEIENLLLGNWTQSEFKHVARELGEAEVKEAVPQKGRGNSGICRITMVDGGRAVLKVYPDEDDHDRLFSEYKSLEFLDNLGVGQISKRIGCSRDLNIGMYQWIDGSTIQKPDENDITRALEWIGRLHAVRKSPEWRNFPNASAAVFSGKQLEEQISKRLALLINRSVESDVLQKYLRNELWPVAEEIIEWSRVSWPKSSKYDLPLSRRDCTLSPSDFGFHNALRQDDGSLVFIDFEYFGWDDPAKLIVDFILHPAMELTEELKVKWVEGMTRVYGSNVRFRLDVMWPGLSICWCMILLNEFRQDLWLRRVMATQKLPEERNKIMLNQLNQSRKMLSRIRSQYREFPF